MKRKKFENTTEQNLIVVITVILINMMLTSTIKFFIYRGFQLPILTIDRLINMSEFMKLVLILLIFRRIRSLVWNVITFVKMKLKTINTKNKVHETTDQRETTSSSEEITTTPKEKRKKISDITIKFD